MSSTQNWFYHRSDDGSASEMSFDGFGSDIEGSSTSSLEPNLEQRYFWLGKKCFEHLAAAILVAQNPNSYAIEDLDVLSTESMQKFPYADCMDLLVDGEVLSTVNPYKSLMRLIGRKCCEGGEDEWVNISSAIRRSSMPPQRKLGGGAAGVTHSSQPSENSRGNAFSGSNTDSLFKYSVALKEHCDRLGELVKYDEECLRDYSAYFKATVHLQGISFEGTGSSKKVARHHACRQACMAMDIKP